MCPASPTLTDFVVDRGVDGMTILGVLGEAAKLTDAERLDGHRGRHVGRAAGRVPICVGVSAPSTARAIGYAREAQERGAHSVMLAPPQLARPNDAAVRAHYLAVADAIDLPVVVQDHPASSGVWMSVELLLDLAAANPKLRVIKLEDEPTPPKAGRLLAADPTLRVLGGLGGEMLIEELRAGLRGHHDRLRLSRDPRRHRRVATGRVTRRAPRWRSIERARSSASRTRRAQPAHPQAHLPAPRRHRPAPASAHRDPRWTRLPSLTWTTC